MVRATLLGGLAALDAAGTASGRAAAGIATDAPWYLPNTPMTVAGQGFAPTAPVQVESNGVFASATTDAAGNFSIATTAPILPSPTPGVRAFTLTGSDGTNSATAAIRVMAFAAAHTPR